VAHLRRDLARMERLRRRGEDPSESLALRPRRAQPEADVTGVWLGHHYAERPVVGVASDDLAALDLAMRRAAYATARGRSARMFLEVDVRIPQRLGLQLREAREGSLEWLLDVPAWIVAALASAPATALINLITVLSWREAIRVQLRRLALSDEEQQILRESARPAPQVAAPHDVPGPPYPRELPVSAGRIPSFDEPTSAAVPPQGPLPRSIVEHAMAIEPLLDIDVGEVHIRGLRPETEVVVQQGNQLTVVTVRAPKR
jgi:hypothetical protein